jgi:hypothetical protein
MIYHRQDGGVVRTDPLDPTQFRCALAPELHVWKDKALLWKDCLAGRDVEADVRMHPAIRELLAGQG